MFACYILLWINSQSRNSRNKAVVGRVHSKRSCSRLHLSLLYSWWCHKTGHGWSCESPKQRRRRSFRRKGWGALFWPALLVRWSRKRCYRGNQTHKENSSRCLLRIIAPCPCSWNSEQEGESKASEMQNLGHGLVWAALISVAFQGQMRNNRSETKDGHGQRHNSLGKSGLITAVQEGDRCLPEAAIREWTREVLSLSQPSSLQPLLNHREDRAGTTSHGFDLPVLD